MEKKITSVKAKARFNNPRQAELPRRPVVISRDGVVIAALSPIRSLPTRTPREAIDEIRKMPKRRLPEGMSLSDLRRIGRR